MLHHHTLNFTNFTRKGCLNKERMLECSTSSYTTHDSRSLQHNPWNCQRSLCSSSPHQTFIILGTLTLLRPMQSSLPTPPTYIARILTTHTSSDPTNNTLLNSCTSSPSGMPHWTMLSSHRAPQPLATRATAPTPQPSCPRLGKANMRGHQNSTTTAQSHQPLMGLLESSHQPSGHPAPHSS